MIIPLLPASPTYTIEETSLCKGFTKGSPQVVCPLRTFVYMRLMLRLTVTTAAALAMTVGFVSSAYAAERVSAPSAASLVVATAASDDSAEKSSDQIVRGTYGGKYDVYNCKSSGCMWRSYSRDRRGKWVVSKGGYTVVSRVITGYDKKRRPIYGYRVRLYTTFG